MSAPFPGTKFKIISKKTKRSAKIRLKKAKTHIVVIRGYSPMPKEKEVAASLPQRVKALIQSWAGDVARWVGNFMRNLRAFSFFSRENVSTSDAGTRQQHRAENSTEAPPVNDNVDNVPQTNIEEHIGEQSIAQGETSTEKTVAKANVIRKYLDSHDYAKALDQVVELEDLKNICRICLETDPEGVDPDFLRALDNYSDDILKNVSNDQELLSKKNFNIYARTALMQYHLNKKNMKQAAEILSKQIFVIPIYPYMVQIPLPDSPVVKKLARDAFIEALSAREEPSSISDTYLFLELNLSKKDPKEIHDASKSLYHLFFDNQDAAQTQVLEELLQTYIDARVSIVGGWKTQTSFSREKSLEMLLLQHNLMNANYRNVAQSVCSTYNTWKLEKIILPHLDSIQTGSVPLLNELDSVCKNGEGDYDAHIILGEFYLKEKNDIKKAIEYATFYGLTRKSREFYGPALRDLKNAIGLYVSKLSATPDQLLSLEDKNALERQFKLYLFHAPSQCRTLLQNPLFQKDLLEILERWAANTDSTAKLFNYWNPSPEADSRSFTFLDMEPGQSAMANELLSEYYFSKAAENVSNDTTFKEMLTKSCEHALRIDDPNALNRHGSDAQDTALQKQQKMVVACYLNAFYPKQFPSPEPEKLPSAVVKLLNEENNVTIDQLKHAALSPPATVTNAQVSADIVRSLDEDAPRSLDEVDPAVNPSTRSSSQKP